MSAHSESSSWPDLELEPVQNHNAHEGTRRTLSGWLTTMAKLTRRQKEKSYDDADFHRTRAQYPSIPDEEMRNGRLNLTHEWTSRDLEGGPSIFNNAAGKENADQGMPNVFESGTLILPPSPPPRNSISRDDSDLSPKLNLNDDALQKGAGESPRAHSGDSYTIPARMLDAHGKPTPKPLFIVPYAPSKDYIHRQYLEDRIWSKLSDGGARITLVGNGGTGKSQVALQVAFKTKKERPETHVLWLSTSNVRDIQQSLNTISEVLSLTGEEIDEDELFARFLKWLFDPANGKWLVVLDGFDFVGRPLNESRGKRLLQAIPVVSHGSVIMTSRKGQEGRSRMSIVQTWTEEEAVLYLQLRVAKHTTIDEMGRLARELDGSPLALSQAMDLIEESGMMLREYLELLRLEKAKEITTTLGLVGRSAVDPEMVYTEQSFDVMSLTKRIAERERVKMDSATARCTDPSSIAKDSGYGSYESGSIVQEDVEEQQEASDSQSVRTLSSFVDLGLNGRLRAISIFASDLAQSLSPDIPESVEGRELVVVAVQDALRA